MRPLVLFLLSQYKLDWKLTSAKITFILLDTRTRYIMVIY